MVRLVKSLCVLGLLHRHHCIGRAQGRDDLAISLFEVDSFSEASETVLESGDISCRVRRRCRAQRKVLSMVERGLRSPRASVEEHGEAVVVELEVANA